MWPFRDNDPHSDVLLRITESVTQFAPYYLCSALQTLWTLLKIMHFIGNKVPFGTQPVSLSVIVLPGGSLILLCVVDMDIEQEVYITFYNIIIYLIQ